MPLSEKVEIVQSAQSSGSIEQTARKYTAQPAQIRRWLNNAHEIVRLAEQNPKQFNIHKSRKIIDSDLK